MTHGEKLRALPAVHEVLERLAEQCARFPRTLVTSEIRQALDRARSEIRAGHLAETSQPSIHIETQVEQALAQLERPSLRRVINATGVVLHTNLGRAPLAHCDPVSGYSNLEYNLATGRRDKRDLHVSGLLERLLGAPGIAVNNNAAAVFLALQELAAGGEAIVSRGELIEIGDGFRIPGIMERSGAVLREVGTTNRTHIDDYRAAINQRTRLLMRVHPSNFRMSGFTARPDVSELAALGREFGIPVYEDLGSGCIADLRQFGIDEPLVSDSLKAGVDLVSFSGDKLLGGPQAGILAGNAEMVARLRRNPLFRALRLDKIIYQMLEETLRRCLFQRWHEIPALAMIRQTPAEIKERSEALLHGLPGFAAEIIPGNSVIGGGATPEQSLPTWLIATANGDAHRAEYALRGNHPPVIARIEDHRLLLDLRTVFPQEEEELRRALDTCLPRCSPESSRLP